MTKLLAGFLGLVLCLSVHAQQLLQPGQPTMPQGPTVGSLHDMLVSRIANDADRELADTYLLGSIHAVWFADSKVCMPSNWTSQDVLIVSKDLSKIIRIAAAQTIADDVRSQPLPVFVKEVLEKQFPCPRVAGKYDF